MGFFEKVFSALGAGAPSAALEVETSTVRPGDEVRGTLVITGGKKECTLHNIQVMVEEHEAARMEEQSVVQPKEILSYHEEPLATPQPIKPGEVVRFPVALHIADRAKPSNGKKRWHVFSAGVTTDKALSWRRGHGNITVQA